MRSFFVLLFAVVSFYLFPQERDAQGKAVEKELITCFPEYITPDGSNMFLWISKNLVVPSVSVESIGCTRVIVEFSISDSGTLDDVKVTCRTKELSDALRPFFLSMKTWKAALQNGKSIATRLSLPIYIRL